MTTKKEQLLSEINQMEEKLNQLRKTAQEIDKSRDVMDRIQTFEDAYEETKSDPEVQELYNDLQNTKNVSILATIKLQIIARAFNEGWKPNWSNSNEYKYYSWFEMKASGLGFTYSSADFTYTDSSVGSRLCFKTRTMAECAGKRFEKLYEQMLCFQ